MLSRVTFLEYLKKGTNDSFYPSQSNFSRIAYAISLVPRPPSTAFRPSNSARNRLYSSKTTAIRLASPPAFLLENPGMPSVPKRIADRFAAGIKRFQPILTAAKSRDVNQSDTSIIVTDILSEVFGYDKNSEITSEFTIRGTCCAKC